MKENCRKVDYGVQILATTLKNLHFRTKNSFEVQKKMDVLMNDTVLTSGTPVIWSRSTTEEVKVAYIV